MSGGDTIELQLAHLDALHEAQEGARDNASSHMRHALNLTHPDLYALGEPPRLLTAHLAPWGPALSGFWNEW